MTIFYLGRYETEMIPLIHCCSFSGRGHPCVLQIRWYKWWEWLWACWPGVYFICFINYISIFWQLAAGKPVTLRVLASFICLQNLFMESRMANLMSNIIGICIANERDFQIIFSILLCRISLCDRNILAVDWNIWCEFIL